MRKIIFSLIACPFFCRAQLPAYQDSLRNFIENYVNTHEVVKGKDRGLLQFYPPDSGYRVTATFQRSGNSKWFWMDTHGSIKKQYREYGLLSFRIRDTLLQLHVYQSMSLQFTKDLSDYLFLPFTDMTNGIETYSGGRYIDLKLSDIQNNHCGLDFNKAYNPYCAYTSGYNCPIPPKENDLPIAVRAGEKNYLKH